MKNKYTLKILHWLINAILLVVGLGALGLVIFGIFISGNPLPDAEKLKGVTSFTLSTTYNNNHFFYEFKTESDGSYKEKIYMVNPGQLYKFSVADSVMASFNVRNEELSSSRQILGGFIRTHKNVYTSQQEMIPLRLGHPGYPITREQFNKSIRFTFLSILFHGVFLFGFFWFLRKFILGLQKNKFFTDTNFSYLRNMAYILILYPFATLVWNRIANIDPPEIYGGNMMGVATPEFGFTFLIFGITLWIIATVFQYGIELQKEQELTI